jgi:hypothetical protein
VSNPNKDRGSRWELAVRRFLGASGLSYYKPVQEGREDVGDVHAPPFVLQVKDEARHDFPGYLRAAARQTVAAQARYGVGLRFPAAVVKKRNAPTEAAYVVMTLATFTAVLRDLRRLEPGP